MSVRIRDDCRLFYGSKPCVMNKRSGAECADCKSYDSYKKKFLIIKLESIGDVLRTTCILPKIKEKFPSSYIAWVTKPECVEVLSFNPYIDKVLDYSDTGILAGLGIEKWDCVYNLDNSHSSAALTTLAKAKMKRGFFLSERGGIVATNEAALRWLEMASFDRVKKENRLSYQEIIHDICGFARPISKPLLFIPEKISKWADSLINKTLLVGVNTGSGSRWPKKMPDEAGIVSLIKALLKSVPQANVVLLGGANEREKNNAISKSLNSEKVINIGTFYSIAQFGAIINRCDVVLTADSLALHVACALGVPVVALFGPTSPSEIYDYAGLVLKKSSPVECLCCYSDCNKTGNCMNLLSADSIIAAIKKQINRKKKARGIIR